MARGCRLPRDVGCGMPAALGAQGLARPRTRAMTTVSLGFGPPALDELVSELLGADLSEGTAALRPLKPPRVYRLELVPGLGRGRSVIVKRLDSAVAQRAQFAAERWLPALGLADACA